MAESPVHLIVEPKCAECGRTAARIELVPPHVLPARWDSWSAAEKQAFDKWHRATKWLFVYEGPGGGNGQGADVEEAEAAAYAKAFVEPLQVERVQQAQLHDNAGFCVACAKPYCDAHWRLAGAGGGKCPRGHFANLEPHWAPETE